MLKMFKPTDVVFDTNGDRIIKPSRARVRKEDNGEFYLDIDAPLDYINDLVAGNIIVAPTPQGEQAFRVSNPEKTRSKITLRAKHVYYDTENYLILDSNIVNKDCNYALDTLNSAAMPNSPFTTISDVKTVDSYRCIRTSLREAIEETVARWGGHLVRDNFNIGIRANIGNDNQVTIQYGKNLQDISCVENWDNVCTSICPVGKDGLMLNYINPDASVFIDAPLQYEIPYTKTVTFDQSEIEDDGDPFKTALLDDLEQKAKQYLQEHSVPQINYILKANVEKITDIGDVIEVKDSRLGISLMTNVIAYEYDCILGKYVELTFGNFKKTMNGFSSNLQATVNEKVEKEVTAAETFLSEELTRATSEIWGMMGNSHVIYNGDSIFVVDKLPKETATNVILINSGGIGFSNTGINGQFNSAWTIDGTLNMDAINVINFTANMIKGGVIKLGGTDFEEQAALELRDTLNRLCAKLDKDGIKVYGTDGSYVLLNNDVGLAGYDSNGSKIFWADQDEFFMKKAVVQEEILLCNRARFIPITITDGNLTTNDGIGLVAND